MRRPLPLERLEGVAGTRTGLTEADATARLARYGPNEIVPVDRLGWLVLVKDTVADPMLWFLIATAALFFLLGDRIEAITLSVATIPLVGMDLFLHWRTRISTEGLSGRLAAKARVCRDERVVEIPARQLVPGDLVVIAAGDNVPADGILLSGDANQVDESILTGESWAVAKVPLEHFATGHDEVLVESEHWMWAGTRLLTGEAWIRIINTGIETVYGEIVRSAREGGRDRTPLQRAIARLVRGLLVASVLLCLLLAAVRYMQGFGLLDALVSAVTLAVAALPEEFPILLTVFLGVGVYRLAKRKALVQRAVVVENIGRVTCICTDKTGTITEGRLVLAHGIPAAGIDHDELLALAALACRAESNDPMDVAIMASVPGNTNSEPVASFPFTEARKRETNIWRMPDNSLLAVTKGAPEILLSLCRLTHAERRSWEAKVDELAAGAHKLIVCATLTLSSNQSTDAEPAMDFDLAGILAFEDPIRESVPEAIAACRQAGIHVVMITGDHPRTALAVAREVGLGGEDPRLLQADAVQTSTLDAGTLKQLDIVARAVPSQKVDVVKALQRAGEVVAVTGDGVNDVPALQIADIGLAMGEHGTRSAREVAAIVLLDENFRTIIQAIAEGRQLFRNLRLGFAYLLMIHIPLVATATFIPLAGYPLLYLPVHVVWLELIIHPTALLVFQELPADNVLSATTQHKTPRFFSRHQWIVIISVGMAAAVIIGIGYHRSLGASQDVPHARAMTLALLSFASATIMTVLSRLRTGTSRIVAAATVLLAIVLIQTPLLDTFLQVEPLHVDDWLIAGAGAGFLAVIAWTGRFRRG